MAIVSPYPIESMGWLEDKDGRPPRYEYTTYSDGDKIVLKAESQPVRAVLSPYFIESCVVIKFEGEEG